MFTCQIAMLAFGLLDALGQPYSPNASLPPPPTKPTIVEIGAGVFQIGEVRFDKNKKSVSFPGHVNMKAGLVEYAVVGRRGKLHESLLATQAEPYHIHVAVLLLGGTNQTAKAESGPALKGHPIRISVSWKDGDRQRQVSLEELISRDQGKTMERGPWIYNGSRLVDGAFLAQRDESIVAVIHDPEALINYPRRGRESDDVWSANEKTVPAVSTPVQITLEILEPVWKTGLGRTGDSPVPSGDPPDGTGERVIRQ